MLLKIRLQWRSIVTPLWWHILLSGCLTDDFLHSVSSVSTLTYIQPVPGHEKHLVFLCMGNNQYSFVTCSRITNDSWTYSFHWVTVVPHSSFLLFLNLEATIWMQTASLLSYTQIHQRSLSSHVAVLKSFKADFVGVLLRKNGGENPDATRDVTS